jgi:hypothetical protein
MTPDLGRLAELLADYVARGAKYLSDYRAADRAYRDDPSHEGLLRAYREQSAHWQAWAASYAMDFVDKLPAVLPHLIEQARRVEGLTEALGWFVNDERFQVGVGGNPNVVEKMIADAKAIYQGRTP